MQLLDHLSLTVRDIERARGFYKAVLLPLGAVVAYEREDAIGFGERNSPRGERHTYISIFQSAQAVPDQRRHVCFRAGSVEQVKAFHRAGLAAGGTDEGEPGLRNYHAGYYAAFLLDPDGNKVEAAYHDAEV